jgi:hypothetical protein
MLVEILEQRDCGDRVAACALELGIEILHPGSDRF